MISIVIPVYNELARLARGLELAQSFVDRYTAAGGCCEVVLVDDGSQDNTLALALTMAVSRPWLRVFSIDHAGKGAAVRAGMLAATGDIRVMCDIDFSMPPDEIGRLAAPALLVPVVIGVRSGSCVEMRWYRWLISRGINALARLLVTPGLQDTQCGFKAFQARAAIDLFSRQTMPGFSFDVEILYLARRLGYAIQEESISWVADRRSTVKVVDGLRFIRDLILIRWNDLQGVYSRPAIVAA